MSNNELIKLEPLPGFVSDLPEIIDNQPLEEREHPGHNSVGIGIEVPADGIMRTFDLSEPSTR